jgi:hypothetical protein
MGHADVVTQNGVEKKCFARDIYISPRRRGDAEEKQVLGCRSAQRNAGQHRGKLKAYQG